jgi:hypothetical protein
LYLQMLCLQEALRQDRAGGLHLIFRLAMPGYFSAKWLNHEMKKHTTAQPVPVLSIQTSCSKV